VPNYSDPTLTVVPPAAINLSRGPISIGSILVLVAGILGVGLAGFIYWQTLQAQTAQRTADASVATLNAELSSKQSVVSQISEYNQVAVGLKAFLGAQDLWPQTLTNFEQHIYKHLALTAFQFTDKGAVTIAGTAPSYTDYAQLYSSLTTDPDFSVVKPVSVSKDASGNVDFSFSFTMAPSLFVSALSPQS
jgi:Tfp pilus assembly protein PilN